MGDLFIFTKYTKGLKVTNYKKAIILTDKLSFEMTEERKYLFHHILILELKKATNICHSTQKTNQSQRQKKSRTVFTKRQILKLESMFYAKRYLSNTDRIELSKSLSLSESQVRIISFKVEG